MNGAQGLTPRNEGQLAAQQFYKLLQARNPIARQRWSEILVLARQGDPEAVRAVRLMQSVMRSPVQIGATAPKPVVTPQQIEMLRQVLVSARYSVPGMMGPGQPAPPVPGVSPYGPMFSPPASPPAPPPAQGQVFAQIPGGVVGYTGEGYYQVVKPQGIGLFSGPTMNRPAVQILPTGTMVRVFAQSENSYVQIDQPAPGFVCMTCAEDPGGPWLIRKS